MAITRAKTKTAPPTLPRKDPQNYAGLSRQEFIQWVESVGDDVDYMLVMNQVYLESRGRPMYPPHELKIIEEIARKRRVDSGHG